MFLFCLKIVIYYRSYNHLFLEMLTLVFVYETRELLFIVPTQISVYFPNFYFSWVNSNKLNFSTSVSFFSVSVYTSTMYLIFLIFS